MSSAAGESAVSCLRSMAKWDTKEFSGMLECRTSRIICWRSSRGSVYQIDVWGMGVVVAAESMIALWLGGRVVEALGRIDVSQKGWERKS